MDPCYGFHASSIPAEADTVIDIRGRVFLRAGPRSWRQDVHADQPARFHEAWLLDTYGPMRCPVMEQVLIERDEKLTAILTELGDRMPDMPDAAPAFEDALMLMRAGWLAWSPKQRREALESLRQTEMGEVAKTS